MFYISYTNMLFINDSWLPVGFCIRCPKQFHTRACLDQTKLEIIY